MAERIMLILDHFQVGDSSFLVLSETQSWLVGY